MGNWIGGDPRRHPNVNAATLDMAIRRHGETVLRHYLTKVHELGAELSISRMLVAAPPSSRASPSALATTTRTATTNPIAAL